MPKQDKPFKAAADSSRSEAKNPPNSPPADPFVEALYARYVAGEITVDEAIELARAEALRAVRSSLTAAEYSDLEEFMRHVRLPHEAALRRRQCH